MCLFHHGTLHICVCSITEYTTYVFVPKWNITYLCLFHCGTLQIYVRSIMAHFTYVFLPIWLITYMCLFHHGTLHMCVCVGGVSIVVIQKWNWVFVNCYENKNCISTAAEYFKMCQDGTDTLLYLEIVLKVLIY
jgi:hypothetical protein